MRRFIALLFVLVGVGLGGAAPSSAHMTTSATTAVKAAATQNCQDHGGIWTHCHAVGEPYSLSVAANGTHYVYINYWVYTQYLVPGPKDYDKFQVLAYFTHGNPVNLCCKTKIAG